MNGVQYKKWEAGFCLVTFVTVLLSAVRAEVSVNTVIIRCSLAVLAVLILCRVLYQVITTSEEMGRGEGKE